MKPSFLSGVAMSLKGLLGLRMESLVVLKAAVQDVSL